jgi:hypothetical protein
MSSGRNDSDRRDRLAFYDHAGPSYQRNWLGVVDFGGGDNSHAKKIQDAVDRRKFLRGSAFLAAAGLKRADTQQAKSSSSGRHLMPDKPNSPLLVAFVASASGSWRIDRINPVIGEGLPAADRLEMVEGPMAHTNNDESK